MRALPRRTRRNHRLTERRLLTELGHREHHRDAGRVVVGARINLAVAHAEVIVMGGNHKERHFRVGAEAHAQHIGARTFRGP